MSYSNYESKSIICIRTHTFGRQPSSWSVLILFLLFLQQSNVFLFMNLAGKIITDDDTTTAKSHIKPRVFIGQGWSCPWPWNECNAECRMRGYLRGACDFSACNCFNV